MLSISFIILVLIVIIGLISVINWKLFRGRYWFIIPLALVALLFIGFMIISVYPSLNEKPYTEADKAKSLDVQQLWGVKNWTKIFGGPCTDYAFSISQTSDGGYIIGGDTDNCTKAASGGRIYIPFLLKTDVNGNKVWEKFNYSGFAHSIQQAPDGGYIIAGNINLPRKEVGAYGASLQADIYLMKTDVNGNVVWEKNYGEDKPDNGVYTLEIGQSVQQTSDSGYIIVGSTGPYGEKKDVYLIKTDANGNKQWSKVFGVNKTNERTTVHARLVQQTSDGGYIVVGWTETYWINGTEKDEDIYLVKTDANGNKVWDKLVDAFGQRGDDRSRDVKQTSDGGYIVVGYKTSFRKDIGQTVSNAYLLKTDPDGNKVWEKLVEEKFGEGLLVQQTSDGGYMVTATLATANMDSYLTKIKTDSQGNKIWEKAIDEFTPYGPYYYPLLQTLDGGYIGIIDKIDGIGENGLEKIDIVLVKIDETQTPRPPEE